MTRKATLAVLAGTLWMLGFDVVPLGHMLFHDSLDEHHHGHHHESARDPHADHEHDEAPTPLEHGEGSVAHKDLAAQTPLPAVPEVLEALLAQPVPSSVVRNERPTDRSPQTTRARAPPTRRT
jgi:hypothetical protein